MNAPDTAQGVASSTPVASSPAVQAARPRAAASLPLRQDGSPQGRDSLLALFTTAVPAG
ncbi:hypothetical protein [Ewingella americana]|uniref:hypothetical protein n=1 Tax=Ewingella americana TaxID=41202 RepID=UPI0012AE0B86|nr:hypothetical protein [Ewingella americana]MRT06063.1 hypothetical protein [Ewingella americana]